MTQEPKQPYGWHASEDPESYERACLEAVRRMLEDIDGKGTTPRTPKVIHEIRLQGKYPDTELVVDVEIADRRAALTSRLHGDDFGTPQAPGYQEWPEGVAQMVYIEVLEFGP